jgi:iron-sulfur cluster assembly accessory protein
MRSRSRWNSVRIGEAASAISRPRLAPGSLAQGARQRSPANRSSRPGCSMPRTDLSHEGELAPYLPKDGPMSSEIQVELTERAARRLVKVLAGEPAGSMLRVAVNGGGCSGFQYAFSFEQTRNADDKVIERDGAAVAIDAVSLPFMAGARIDFVDDLIGQSFRIDNPNATASCGCGTSFSM